jgi:hypothetical protein
MKGFLSFIPFAFTLVPPDMKIQVARTWCLEILFGILFIKFIDISMNKLATFGYVVDDFLLRKFKIISENF